MGKRQWTLTFERGVYLSPRSETRQSWVIFAPYVQHSFPATTPVRDDYCAQQPKDDHRSSKAMVSSSRPSLRSSSARFARRDRPESPIDRVEAPGVTTKLNKHPQRVRQSSNQSTKENHLKTNGIEKLNVQARKATRSQPLPHRPSVAADRSTPKPPTKVTVAQPHGSLLETVNGVRKRLNITHDDVSSKAPTPGPGSINEVSIVNGKPPEARALRSKDGGSRIKSELAIYFGNYDEVINDIPRAPGMLDY